MEKGRILRFMMMSLGYLAMMILTSGLPAPPSPTYPFGKPANWFAINLAVVMFIIDAFAWIYFYKYRKIIWGADYFWIGSVIRDLLGRWREATFAIPREAEEEELRKDEMMIMDVPEITEVVEKYQEALKEEIIWRKVPTVIFEEDGSRYEGVTVIGSHESLLENIGQGGFRRVEIDVDGLPILVDYCPLEFLDLGHVRVIQRKPLDRRVKHMIKQRIAHGKIYGSEFGYIEEPILPTGEKIPYYYEVKIYPCFLLVGSPLMYQKLAAYGIGILKLAQTPEEFEERMSDLRRRLTDTIIDSSEKKIQMLEKISQDYERMIDRKVEFGVKTRDQKIEVVGEQRILGASWKTWLAIIAVTTAMIIGSLIILKQFGIIGGVTR